MIGRGSPGSFIGEQPVVIMWRVCCGVAREVDCVLVRVL